jgi:hypothetical protein
MAVWGPAMMYACHLTTSVYLVCSVTRNSDVEMLQWWCLNGKILELHKLHHSKHHTGSSIRTPRMLATLSVCMLALAPHHTGSSIRTPRMLATLSVCMLALATSHWLLHSYAQNVGHIECVYVGTGPPSHWLLHSYAQNVGHIECVYVGTGPPSRLVSSSSVRRALRLPFTHPYRRRTLSTYAVQCGP